MNTYHPSRIKPETRHKIIMAQEPITLLRSDDFMRTRIECAKTMIKNGLAFGFPAMVRKGKRIIRRIRNRQFMNAIREAVRRNGPFPVDEEGRELLEARRAWFIQRIEEKENETTTPLS